jgi:hypothetical protein
VDTRFLAAALGRVPRKRKVNGFGTGSGEPKGTKRISNDDPTARALKSAPEGSERSTGVLDGKSFGQPARLGALIRRGVKTPTGSDGREERFGRAPTAVGNGFRLMILPLFSRWREGKPGHTGLTGGRCSGAEEAGQEHRARQGRSGNGLVLAGERKAASDDRTSLRRPVGESVRALSRDRAKPGGGEFFRWSRLSVRG